MANRVQAQSAAGQSVTSVTVTLGTPTTPGNALVVITSCFYATHPYSTIADNNGSTFSTPPGDVTLSYQGTLSIASAFGIAGRAGHSVTVTMPSSDYFIVTVIEVAGIDRFDKSNGAVFNSYTSGPTLTTAYPGEYLVGAHSKSEPGHSTNTTVPAAGWAQAQFLYDGSFHRLFVQDRVVSATGAYASSGTGDSFDQNLIATYRAVSAPTGLDNAYAALVARDGATSYWPLDDPSGSTVARDVIGARPGTLSPGVVPGRNGLWGRAMALGTLAAGQPGYIDIGPGSPAPATGGFSLELWYWQSPGTTNTPHALIVKGPPIFLEDGVPPTPGHYSLVTIPYVSNGRIELQLSYPTSAAVSGLTQFVAVQRWHHVVVTFTPGAPALTQLYLDGLLDGGGPVAFLPGDGSLTTYLGEFPWYASQGYGLDGRMQSVAWYPSVLGDAQVATHYQLGLALGSQPPLSVLALAGDDDMLRYNLAVPITPSDTQNMSRLTDAIYVGVTGDVTLVLQNGQARTFTGVAAGSILPVMAQRINATATTAGSLLALYQQ